MQRLSLDYESLAKINQRLVYASISGFGQTGPYSKRPAFDAVVQAMSGIMSITGEENGPPARVGTSIGDIGASLFGTIGILGGFKRSHDHGTRTRKSTSRCSILRLPSWKMQSRDIEFHDVPRRFGSTASA